MADDDEYSPEQKAKIARHFLYMAPHGEVTDIVKDLKKVVKPSSLINDDWVKDALLEYYVKKASIISGDTSKVIACLQNKVQKDIFLHPDKKVICTVDALTQKIVKEDDASHLVQGNEGRIEDFRSAISSKLNDYLSAFYEDGSSPNSVASGMGQVFAAPNGMIAVVISYKNLNQNNYWTGGWHSDWSTNIAKNGKVQLNGKIQLQVHYYEDGNVQLNSTFKEEAQIDVSSAEETAEILVDTIMKRETAFQKKLDQFYVQMHDSTFKNMRRFLPKTGKKMDWRARTHNLVSEAASQ